MKILAGRTLYGSTCNLKFWKFRSKIVTHLVKCSTMPLVALHVILDIGTIPGYSYYMDKILYIMG